MSDDTRSRKAIRLEDLQRRILAQELGPGGYLDETQISDAYRISRPPLREILRQLAGEGYVVLHENRGAQVAPMTHKTLRNFFVAAPMIYAAVTRLAADLAVAHWELSRAEIESFVAPAGIQIPLGRTPASRTREELHEV